MHITQPFKGTDSGNHPTQYHIKTNGQLTHSHPQLTPYKLVSAKMQINKMLNDSIIHPSDSPYASPLLVVLFNHSQSN